MRLNPTLLLLTLLLLAVPVSAEDGAESPPTVRRALIQTSMGEIEIELWPRVAPQAVEVFLGLAQGKGEFKDVADPSKTVRIEKPFYDGLIFHRVIKGFMLQGGCPQGNGMGDAGFKFADEINATVLGLDKLKVLTDGRPHAWVAGLGQAYWQQKVLFPVIQLLHIDVAKIKDSPALQKQIMQKLESMTLKELYELQGYVYDDTLPSVAPKRGHLALANAGPNTNSSQFFINVGDPEWLTGRHTVFGKVTRGMEIVDKIAAVPVAQGSNKPLKDVKILSIRPLP